MEIWAITEVLHAVPSNWTKKREFRVHSFFLLHMYIYKKLQRAPNEYNIQNRGKKTYTNSNLPYDAIVTKKPIL